MSNINSINRPSQDAGAGSLATNSKYKFCEVCKVYRSKSQFARHRKSKTHIGNVPNPLLASNNSRIETITAPEIVTNHGEKSNLKQCTRCNKSVSKSNWARHAKSSKHLSNPRDRKPLKLHMCTLCNAIVSEGWESHTKTEQHILKNWARDQHIHDFKSRSLEELKRIKVQLDQRVKDHSVFDLEKLQGISRDHGVDAWQEKSRPELLECLDKIMKAPNNLKYRSEEYIKSLASRMNLGTLFKTKERLIAQIYMLKKLFYCEICDFVGKDRALHNVSEEHILKTGKELALEEEISINAKFKKIILNNIANSKDLTPFLESKKITVVDKLREYLILNPSIKLQLSLECSYVREKIDTGIQYTDMTFHTKSGIVSTMSDFRRTI